MNQEELDESKGGCLPMGVKMFAGLCSLLAVVSVFNIAFDLDLEISVSRTGTPLPTD